MYEFVSQDNVSGTMNSYLFNYVSMRQLLYYPFCWSLNVNSVIIYMTGFMKTVSIRKKIEREAQEKEDKRVVEKKTDIPFDFYIVYIEIIPGEKKNP